MRLVPEILAMALLPWACSPLTSPQGAAEPTAEEVSPLGEAVGSEVVDPSDVWLFTDPRARALYPTDMLARDIRSEVMQGGRWMPDEIEYQLEILRLQRQGVVSSVAYWHISPFPTVYQALYDGQLTVDGRTYEFRAGNAITFRCRMARARNSALTGPLMIFERRQAERLALCGDMKRASRRIDR